MQKTIRRAKEREALYWATELAMAGYTPTLEAPRLIASEDVGLAEPMMPVLIRSLYDS